MIGLWIFSGLSCIVCSFISLFLTFGFCISLHGVLFSVSKTYYRTLANNTIVSEAEINLACRQIMRVRTVVSLQ